MLGVAERVRVWDAALAAVRACMRERGMAEVVTPVRVDAVALEPFIEPIAAPSGSAKWIRTSPELAHKRLLVSGSGAIFEVAAVARAGEVGARHREGFHLLEWYRLGEEPERARADVEAIVSAVFDAVSALGIDTLGEGTRAPARPFATWSALEKLGETLDRELAENPHEKVVIRALKSVRARAGVPLGSRDAAGPDASDARTTPHDPPARTRAEANTWPSHRALASWTELFSLWSDLELEPRVREHGGGVHVVDYPAPLAALARVREGVADRFETYVEGVELANGYVELRDPLEQRRRFDAVAAMRRQLGAPELPMPEAFLAALEEPGLPACTGVALGLERLVALACGARDLDAVVLF